jgi:hypothetical protein
MSCYFWFGILAIYTISIKKNHHFQWRRSVWPMGPMTCCTGNHTRTWAQWAEHTTVAWWNPVLKWEILKLNDGMMAWSWKMMVVLLLAFVGRRGNQSSFWGWLWGSKHVLIYFSCGDDGKPSPVTSNPPRWALHVWHSACTVQVSAASKGSSIGILLP